jgi:hypothetical protein
MRIEAIDLLGVEGNRRILHVLGYSEVSLSGVSNFCVGKERGMDDKGIKVVEGIVTRKIWIDHGTLAS